MFLVGQGRFSVPSGEKTGCEKTQVDWGLPAKQHVGGSIPSSHSKWKGSSVGRAMV